jgi:hypothetical protein
MCIDKKQKKRGDIMRASTARVFEVKPEKTKEFLDIMKKPMITRQFLDECKKASHNIKNSKKK